VAMWYSARNNPYYSDSSSGTEAQLGLMTTDFTPKPAYGAMRAMSQGIAGGAPAPAGPITIRLTSPKAHSGFTSRLSMAASVSGDQRVTKVVFLVNGHIGAVDRSVPFRSAWKAPVKAGRSAHRVTIRARAFDADRLVANSKPVSLRADSHGHPRVG
jgi:Big-like domain-containing protein